MRERAAGPRIMFSVAEVSGDLFAADLVRHLLRLRPDASVFGAGGAKMAAAGVDVRLDVCSTSTIGPWDLIRALPEHLRSGLAIRRLLIAERPDLLVLVDAPGFNFPLARIARRLGIRTVYYIAPQTWLWNPDVAAARLRGAVDLVIPITDQEARLYERAGVTSAYFGHPLADLATTMRRSMPDHRRRLGLDPDIPVIGLFPGSRRAEIARLLPDMVTATRLLGVESGRPLQVIVSVATSGLQPLIERCIAGRTDHVRLVDRPHDVLHASDISLAASGTVLLEAVALDAPAIMTYRLDRLTHYYAKYVLKMPRVTPFRALPNIIGGEGVIRELVEEQATAVNMAAALREYLTQPDVRRQLHAGYARIRARMGTPGVVDRAAERILAMLHR